MLYRVSVSSVIVCFYIVIRIELAVAFSWKNVSTNIISCEHEDIQLTWEYELNPTEYVKAKTWYTGMNKTAKRIAFWKDTDGLMVEHEYRNRVTMMATNSLLLKDVTTSDEGWYTLIVNFPFSPEPDPRLTLSLTVYVPPLENCCKPTIHRLESGTGLRADLHPQACGTRSYYLKWNHASGTTANGDILVFDTTDITGIFTVCVTGITVETCFKGRKESLCQEEYIVTTLTWVGFKGLPPYFIYKMSETPQTKEHNITLIAVVSTVGTLILLAVIVLLIIVLNWRRIKKYRKRNRNWKALRASLRFKNDDRMLISLILTEDAKMDRATMEISHMVYFTYNNSKELELKKINTARIASENSEIRYMDNNSDDVTEVEILTANDETKVSYPSYVQCMYHKEKLLKLLILQGDLGIGKTYWCRKFVKTWCEAHECQYYRISIKNKSEGIKTLNSFPLLFFVSLRNVEKDQTFKDIIKQQCMMGRDTHNGQFYDDDLDLLMDKRPEKLIFIIHGVDEADTDVSILNDIVSMTKNSLTILTCRDWEPLQSKYGIREEDYLPMAYITLKHINAKNLQSYASIIFDEYGYPKDAVLEFMGLVGQNKLEQLLEEPFFLQPLINCWHRSGMLPSNTAEVCLYLIEENLKEKREQLRECDTLNLDLDVPRFIPKARGKVFVIRYGHVLCSLGKVALLCLLNKGSQHIFHEDNLMECTNIHDQRLVEICIAAKLVSTAPVSVRSRKKKRLCFQNRMIQLFLVAFHLVCAEKSQAKELSSEESKVIQSLRISLTSA